MLTGQPLTPVGVFMLLGFIDLVTTVTCSEIASALLQTYGAYASLQRIEDFLLLENLAAISINQCREEGSSTELVSGHLDQKGKVEEVFNVDQVEYQGKPRTLYVSNLTYNQIEREDKFILKDIELATGSPSLTVITGSVENLLFFQRSLARSQA